MPVDACSQKEFVLIYYLVYDSIVSSIVYYFCKLLAFVSNHKSKPMSPIVTEVYSIGITFQYSKYNIKIMKKNEF